MRPPVRAPPYAMYTALAPLLTNATTCTDNRLRLHCSPILSPRIARDISLTVTFGELSEAVASLPPRGLAENAGANHPGVSRL